MAHLPGRVERDESLIVRIAKCTSWAAILGMVALLPSRTSGQEVSPGASEDPGAFAAAALRSTSVREHPRWMFGGSGGFEFSAGRDGHRVRVGGGGYVLGNDVSVFRGGSGLDVELGLGYGGLIVEYSVRLTESRFEVAAGALLGAGNADLRNPVSGVQVDSDNFLVLEPTLTLAHPISDALRISLTGGYRGTSGFELSPEIRPSSMRGYVFGLGLTASFR